MNLLHAKSLFLFASVSSRRLSERGYRGRERTEKEREREREREGGEESRAVCKLNDVICQEMEIFAKMHALAISPLSVNFSFVVDSRSRKKKKVGEAATRKP